VKILVQPEELSSVALVTPAVSAPSVRTWNSISALWRSSCIAQFVEAEQVH
jgi:hypothetical protein